MNPPTGRIRRVGVVVPARDEVLLLPRCLAAIRLAVLDLDRATDDVTVDVVVVLDRCTDGSAAVVAADRLARGVEVVAGTVGRARQIGAEAVMEIAEVDSTELWIACTDADSAVPRSWLVEQVRFGDAGADAVVGTVAVADEDWAGRPRHVRRSWSSSYTVTDGHPHVHGANLGVRASALQAVGGFMPLAAGEDVAVVEALSAAAAAGHGDAVVRTGSIPVLTSARRVSDARCGAGFARFIDGLAGLPNTEVA